MSIQPINLLVFLTEKELKETDENRLRFLTRHRIWNGYFVNQICRSCGNVKASPDSCWDEAKMVESCNGCQ
jgi:ribosomal protein S27E